MNKTVTRVFLAVGCFVALYSVTLWRTESAAAPRIDLQPRFHWIFDSKSHSKGSITEPVSGLHGTVLGEPTSAAEPTPSMSFGGPDDGILLRSNVTPNSPLLPTEVFTLAAWMRVDERTQWGGVLSCLQHNGRAQKGVVFGFNNSEFVFGLATKGGNTTGQGKLTYLSSNTKYQLGRWYHVAAVYDGKEMQIYVNGKLDGKSKEQSGPVLYADKAPLIIGRYRDQNEDYPAPVTLKELLWCPRAVSADKLASHFQSDGALAAIEPPPLGLKFLLDPYQQYATRTSIVIMSETDDPADCTVEYGEKLPLKMSAQGKPDSTVHEVKLENLQPNSKYFYRVVCKTRDGRSVASRVLTFGTAVDPSSAFSFTVVGDTQRNPKVTTQIAKLMWERRPHFVLHNGDVVDDGAAKWQWRGDLFRPCMELFGRVPVFPCIGNHEKDNPFYYQYFSLPTPEYYYSYKYGNAEFFSLDTNTKRTSQLLPGGQQYQWLDKALAQSDARWKICYHHHPVYSSDSNDFGDTFKEKSAEGDLRLRPLQTLYEKHNVDIVFNGHIHLYERSWPLRNGKVDPKGVIHITSGGGGGGLEDFSPLPTWFKAECRADFHFLYLTVHGGVLNMKAFDQEGRLFDQMTLTKNELGK